jgi:type I pantothenate kinase
VQYSPLPDACERLFSMPLEMDFPLSDWLRARFVASQPLVIGVAGGVAAGKSTFARVLRGDLQNWSHRPRVEIVATDGFLFPNAVLAERDITMRKGFPESYDVSALRSAVGALRNGERVEIPLYSHVTYDIDTERKEVIERADVVILDGLHLAQIETKDAPRLIDALLYLDAEEDVIERWFTDRLVPLMEAGVDDPNSFYYAFRTMDDAGRRDFAKRVWQGINLPNLRDHIVKDRDAADLVMHKMPDHSVTKVTERRS